MNSFLSGFLLLFALSFSASAFSSTEKARCLFVSGLLNSASDAVDSAIQLTDAIYADGMGEYIDNMTCDPLYIKFSAVNTGLWNVLGMNKYSGDLDSYINRVQKHYELEQKIGNVSASSTDAYLESLAYARNGALIALQSSSKVILFCHSAGCAFGRLLQQTARRFPGKLIVIGVGAATNHELNGGHVTLCRDDVITTSSGTFLSCNVTNQDESKNCHKFVGCYLRGEDTRKRILSLFKKALGLNTRRGALGNTGSPKASTPAKPRLFEPTSKKKKKSSPSVPVNPPKKPQSSDRRQCNEMDFPCSCWRGNLYFPCEGEVPPCGYERDGLYFPCEGETQEPEKGNQPEPPKNKTLGLSTIHQNAKNRTATNRLLGLVW